VVDDTLILSAAEM